MSKLDTSREARDEQPSNMLVMLVTLAVSKFDTSREVRLEQPLNMSDMLVTFEVSKAPPNVMDVNCAQPANMAVMLVAR